MKMRQVSVADVQEFWEKASCGEALYLRTLDKEGFSAQSDERYCLEPYIKDFAQFSDWKAKRVLEIGVGLGADHQLFVEARAVTTGIDLTERAIDLTRYRLGEFGLQSDLLVADAENLGLPDNDFDLVYSWGVIHHSPNTEQIAREIFRVLKPGGGGPGDDL